MLRAGKIAVLLVALAGTSVNLVDREGIPNLHGIYEEVGFGMRLVIHGDGTVLFDRNDRAWVGTWSESGGAVEITAIHSPMIERWRLRRDGADLVVTSFAVLAEHDARELLEMAAPATRYARVGP